MKLLIKQRVFSWTDTYDIYDEEGNQKYYVKAEFFTLGHVIHVYDKYDREVGCIRQRLMTFLPKFGIEINGEELGEIQKEFSFFTPEYTIDYNGWKIEGDFLGRDYDITDTNGNVIVTISKEIFNWSDTYSLTIYNNENEIPALLTVIAIDAVNCGNN